MVMIDIQGISFTYPGQTTPLFEHFTWRVAPGEFWAVIGPSGSGKSTLLYLIVGVRAPQAGQITVNGETVPRKKNRGKTGLVLQDYGMLPWSTVRENVELGLRIRGFYGQGEKPIGHDKVAFWLNRFGLGQLGDKYPNQISGGQRQRAAIARTLVLEPDVLLMDEPFSALDAVTREDLEQVTLDLQTETGTTTVFVTHNIEEAVFLGRKILVLGDPPHRSPLRVVDNPGAGRPNYRNEKEFLEQTHGLREMLKSEPERVPAG